MRFCRTRSPLASLKKLNRLSPFRSLFHPLPGKGGGDAPARGVRSRWGRRLFAHEVTEGVLGQRGLAATGTILQVRLDTGRFLDVELAVEVGVHQFHHRRAVVHRRIPPWAVPRPRAGCHDTGEIAGGDSSTGHLTDLLQIGGTRWKCPAVKGWAARTPVYAGVTGG